MVAGLLTMMGTAAAQSVATAVAINDWTVNIDANSASFDLGVTDDGDFTYSLGAPFYLQAANNPDGVALTADNTIPWFPILAGNGAEGEQNTASGAYSGVFGSAWATLGDEQGFDLVNLDPVNTITIDLNSLVSLEVQAFTSGNPYFAAAESFGGIEYSLNGGGTNAFYQMEYDDTAAGFSSSGSGDYNFVGVNAGLDQYLMNQQVFVLNPGDDLYVGFYASTDAIAVSPTPSSALTLAFGLGGLALLRRRSKKR